MADFKDSDEDGWDDDDQEGWDDEKDEGNWSDSNDVTMEEAVIHQTVTTPIELAAKIRRNVGEVKLVPFFDATCSLKGTRVDVSLGLRVRRFGHITDEQLEVWGLHPLHQFIVIRITFGPYYLQSHDTPKVEVGAAENLDPLTELKSFRLSWTIKERIKNSLLAVWPPDNNMEMLDHAPDPEALADLMEGSQKEYGICLHALQKFHGEQSQALVGLMDPREVDRLERSLPSSHEIDNELNGVFETRRNDAQPAVEADTSELVAMYQNVDLEAQSQGLSEMFEIPFEAAKLAIGEASSYEEAVGLMSDPEYRANVVALAASMFGEALSSPFGSAPSDAPFQDNSDMSSAPSPSSSGEPPRRKKKRRRGPSSEPSRAPERPEQRGGGGWLRRQAQQFADLFTQHRAHGDDSDASRFVGGDTMTRTLALMCRHNYLVRTLVFALKTLLNGNKRCLICDKKMVFAGLKPSCCSDKMCQYQYGEIGLGFSLADEIIKRGEILDLSMTMLISACHAGRVEIFFPKGVRGPDGFEEESFMNDESPNIAKLLEVAQMCPNMDELTIFATQGKQYLKQKLTEIHPLMYGLLCWVLTSNRTHLRRLKESESIPELSFCSAQFTLASTTPEREAVFQRLKRDHGSFFAFHGSPMGNWHAIMRMGLKNYSGTKHMMHGAAMGNGIYFAAQFSMSLGYSMRAMHAGWNNSQFSSNSSCMAVCEVIKSPQLLKKYPPGNAYVWVVPEEEHCVTRFFVIFDSSRAQSSGTSVVSTGLTIPGVGRSGY